MALAVVTQESRYNQNDISPAGAIGVMQLMPETAEGLGVDPYDEDDNIKGGITELKQCLDQFNGNVELALAAYNAGSGAVQRYGGIPPYSETQNYVSIITGHLQSAPDYNVNSTRRRDEDNDTRQDTNADYDPNFTEKQNQMWELANYASERAKSKWNMNVPAFLIYKQWAEESYQTFDSPCRCVY